MIGWRVTNFCQPQAQHRLWLRITQSPAAMTHDPPPLALSDIIRSFTPSPGHEGEIDEDRNRAHPETSRSVSPEPLEQSEVDSVKSRLLELGIGTSNEPVLSAREQELVDMVPGISPLLHQRSNPLNLSFSDLPLPSDRIPHNSWHKLRPYTSSRSNVTYYYNKPRKNNCGGMPKKICGREPLKLCLSNDVRVLRHCVQRYVSV